MELEGLFLNFRKVFSDAKGDRLIAVGQLDMDQNFEKIRPYQTYFQYKGPLGKWNIRAGHYILSFGLLSDYDTERLVLKAIEDEMTAKIYGYGDDRIKIREAGYLKGKASRALIKSRIAVKDNAVSEIINELTASAPEAKGLCGLCRNYSR
ncbi:MAG: hypothetical protein NC834_00025 [Candidatus Omnitrophica bacterium]|nr:hypothetical protein [Candidatus Omnitrophota bacterium]